MNDRYCIFYNKYLELSAQDMVSCCAPAYGHNGLALILLLIYGQASLISLYRCDSAPLTVA